MNHRKTPGEAEELADILVIILEEGSERVEFVIFHSSRAIGRGLKSSDIDLCIYYKGTVEEMSKFRLKLLSRLPSHVDVQIFQQLPLYVRKEVLKGRVLYAKDRKFLYEVALKTIN